MRSHQVTRASVATYVLKFLQPGRNRAPPNLGFVIKLEVSLKAKCQAVDFLYHLVKNSNNPQRLANEILGCCLKDAALRPVVDLIRQMPTPRISRWVDLMLVALPKHPPWGCKMELGVLPAVNHLASYYLMNLCIAVCDPLGVRLPLLAEEKRYGCQTTLVDSIISRDGWRCPITGIAVHPVDSPKTPDIAYILNPLIANMTPTLRVIEEFTDGDLTAEVITQKIGNVCNAFLFQTDVHVAFTKASVWGLKVVTTPTGETQYLVNIVNAKEVPPSVCSRANQTVSFVSGLEFNLADAPDPSFCNLKLSLSRVFHDSSAWALLNEYYKIKRDIIARSSRIKAGYLGWSIELDNIFFSELQLLAAWQRKYPD